MKGFAELMKSEWMRIRHTVLFWIHLVLPTAGAALFLWYYSFAKWDTVDKVRMYLQVVSCVWPFLCGAVCGMAEEMEADCGYQNFFCLPGRKFQAFLSKWCLLMLAGLFSCLIAVMGFAPSPGHPPGERAHRRVVTGRLADDTDHVRHSPKCDAGHMVSGNCGDRFPVFKYVGRSGDNFPGILEEQ